MRNTFLSALALLCLTPYSNAGDDSCEPELPTGEWISLFNGKDLTGWTPKIRYHKYGENFANTFRVEEGLLKVRYDGYDKEKVGMRHERADAMPEMKRGHESRFWFDTTRHGKSNKGHDFPAKLSKVQRRALLEYLKTL